MSRRESAREQGGTLGEVASDKLNYRVIILAFLACVAVLFATYAIPAGRFVLVIMPPGSSQAMMMQAIGRAGGFQVEPTRFDFMAVAYSDDGNFATRLRSSGALIVLNNMLAAGCKGRTRT